MGGGIEMVWDSISLCHCHLGNGKMGGVCNQIVLYIRGKGGTDKTIKGNYFCGLLHCKQLFLNPFCNLHKNLPLVSIKNNPICFILPQYSSSFPTFYPLVLQQNRPQRSKIPGRTQTSSWIITTNFPKSCPLVPMKLYNPHPYVSTLSNFPFQNITCKLKGLKSKWLKKVKVMGQSVRN